MYGCESWTIKKADCWRTDVFKLWCWRRLLRVPWTSRRSNPSVLKEIIPEYSLEGLLLKLQYFGHLTHWKRPWFWERLKAGGEGDDRGWDGWMASLTQWTWVWAGSMRWWRTEAWCAAVHGVAKSWIWLGDWTKTTSYFIILFRFLWYKLLCFYIKYPPLSVRFLEKLNIWCWCDQYLFNDSMQQLRIHCVKEGK